MKLSARQCSILLYELVRDNKDDTLDAILEQYFLFLRKQKKISLLPRILDMFRAYWNEQNDILCVGINSARRWNEGEREQFLKMLRKHFVGYSVELEEQVDKNLLGGLTLRVRDRVLDLSLRQKLQSLKASFSQL